MKVKFCFFFDKFPLKFSVLHIKKETVSLGQNRNHHSALTMLASREPCKILGRAREIGTKIDILVEAK